MILLTDEEKQLAIKNTNIDYFVDTAAQLIVDNVAKAQLRKLVDKARLNGVLNPDGSMCSEVVWHYNFWQSLLEETNEVKE